MSKVSGVMRSYKQLLKLMNKKPLICTSITTNNKKDYLANLKKAIVLGSDLAELRMDFFKKISSEEMKTIIRKSELPLIVTNRNRENGGLFSKGEKARLSVLESAIEAQPSFVDIELATDSEKRTKIMNLARQNNVGIICSYHDFHRTPDVEEIMKIYDHITSTNADIAKLVFTTKNNKDIRNILKAARKLHSKKIPFTIFGMGLKAQITRMLSPLLGSSLTYSALRTEVETDLGQLSLGHTRKFFNMMEKKGWKKLRNRRDDLIHLAMIELNDDGSYPLASVDKLIKH